MAKVYFTLTGTRHYFGDDFLKKGTKLELEKEPDNKYDREAIMVTSTGVFCKVCKKSLTDKNANTGEE